MKYHYDLDRMKLGWTDLPGMGAQAIALLPTFYKSSGRYINVFSRARRGEVHLRSGSAVRLLPHPA